MDPRAEPVPDSPAAWWRLAASLALVTVGSAGMYVASRVLPVVQSEFDVARADAALPGAAQRVSIVLTATLPGMAFGGRMSGQVFDLSSSYDAAFVDGLAWNLLNLAIVFGPLRRSGHSGRSGLPSGTSRLFRSAPP